MRYRILLSFLLFIFIAGVAGYFYQEQNNQPENVGGVKAELTSGLDACQGKDSAEMLFACYQELAESLVDKYPPIEIYDALEKMDQKVADFIDCHAFTHELGHAVYKSLPNVSEAFAQTSHVCWGGGYHGIIEMHLMKLGIDFESHEKIRQEVERMCESVRDNEDKRLFGRCVHGAGHGFMMTTNNDLPQSLEMCEALPSNFGVQNCYTGVFMENFFSYLRSPGSTEYFDPKNLYYPCTDVDDKYKSACYYYQASAALRNKDGSFNFASLANFCADLPEDEKDTCVFKLGSNAATTRTNSADIKNTCDSHTAQTNTPNANFYCIDGAVRGLLNNYSGDTEKVIDLCGQYKNEVGIKRCFEALSNYIGPWLDSPIDKANLCEGLSDAKETFWCQNPSQRHSYF